MILNFWLARQLQGFLQDLVVAGDIILDVCRGGFAEQSGEAVEDGAQIVIAQDVLAQHLEIGLDAGRELDAIGRGHFAHGFIGKADFHEARAGAAQGVPQARHQQRGAIVLRLADGAGEHFQVFIGHKRLLSVDPAAELGLRNGGGAGGIGGGPVAGLQLAQEFFGNIRHTGSL